jgi:hypothetical protein
MDELCQVLFSGDRKIETIEVEQSNGCMNKRTRRWEQTQDLHSFDDRFFS